MIRSTSLAEPGIQLDRLTIQVAGRPLLKDVTESFRPGEITLIVGPSGAGKTMLLRTIASVSNDPEITHRGSVRIDGLPATAGKVGVVFQDFALFDELSPTGNIKFAQAHARRDSRFRRPRDVDSTKSETAKDTPTPTSSDDYRRSAANWMQELGIPEATRTRNLSGGQRQRLAIARALAAVPAALVYDEPTSGLDPETADQVAQLIRRTADSHQQTTLVVTHDYRSLLPIADRVLIIDPNQQQLVEIPKSSWHELGQRLKEIGRQESHYSHESKPLHNIAKGISTKLASFFETTSSAIGEIALLLWSLLPAWRSFRWGPYYFFHYLRLVAGPSAWVYLMVAGAIMGFVTTYFTFRFLPYANYTEPLLIDNLLGAMGFALYRILVPVLATTLIAARCGAAVASDIGGKKYGRQLEALESLGVRPRRYLLTGILHAFLIGTPLLVGLAYLTAQVTSQIVFMWIHPDFGADYWRLHFHRELSIADQWAYKGTGWLLAKVLVCGIGIALVSYHRGARPKNSPAEVSQSVTSTILWTTLFVLCVHFAFAFIEFELMGAAVP